uniref:ZP domain-containing protein n=1 Tax=Parascaris equorum TaxID=6256 RepID=A0A914RMR6_PAREQ
MICRSVLLVFGLIALAAAIPVDNGVEGIELPFDTCNVARTRSLNPRGVFVTTTVVISFHPQFITKVDRAYRIQCFYMEADKTVSTQLEVSEITTAFQTQIVPMPVCRYEILDGGPTGQPVQFATIGQQVYHKWTCDSETVDTFFKVGAGGIAASSKSGEPAQIRLLKKRQADYDDNTLDVRTDINTLDISDQESALPDDFQHRALRNYGKQVVFAPMHEGICMSPMGL